MDGGRFVNLSDFLLILRALDSSLSSLTVDQAQAVLGTYKIAAAHASVCLTRAQAAVLLDQFLHPFERKEIDLSGKIISDYIDVR